MKRERLGDATSLDKSDELLSSESLRVATTTHTPTHTSSSTVANKAPEEHLPVFWRLFGATLLSIAALAIITVYNQLSASISELRTELNRLAESRGELVKKDDVNNRFQTLGDRVATMQTQLANMQTATDSLKERVVAYRGDADSIRKDISTSLEGFRKDFDLIKKDLAQLEATRTKLSELASEMKVEKTELAKLRQEVDSNRIQDLERKKFRDEQYVKMVETQKELERAIRENGEKIARLEGQITPKATPRTEPTKRQ